MSVSRFWRAKFLFHVEYYVLFLRRNWVHSYEFFFRQNGLSTYTVDITQWVLDGFPIWLVIWKPCGLAHHLIAQSVLQSSILAKILGLLWICFTHLNLLLQIPLPLLVPSGQCHVPRKKIPANQVVTYEGHSFFSEKNPKVFSNRNSWHERIY